MGQRVRVGALGIPREGEARVPFPVGFLAPSKGTGQKSEVECFRARSGEPEPLCLTLQEVPRFWVLVIAGACINDTPSPL